MSDRAAKFDEILRLIERLGEAQETIATAPDDIEAILYAKSIDHEERSRLEKELQRACRQGPGLLNKIRREITMLPERQRGRFLDMHRDQLKEIGIV